MSASARARLLGPRLDLFALGGIGKPRQGLDAVLGERLLVLREVVLRPQVRHNDSERENQQEKVLWVQIRKHIG